MISAEFTLTENGRWYQTTLTMQEYSKLLSLGSLPDGKSVAAIKLFDFPDAEGSLIYDHILAKKGVTPWRVTEINI
jgi:hypothetical protein